MLHQLNLQDKFFDFIKNGTKRVELRLFDEKRQKIQPGDEIEFANQQGETLRTKVIALHRYENYEDLFKDFPIEQLADESMTKEELMAALCEFYTPEKQAQFGVVGIQISL